MDDNGVSSAVNIGTLEDMVGSTACSVVFFSDDKRCFGIVNGSVVTSGGSLDCSVSS